VHIYLATLGHTPLEHFKQMWNGWEEETVEDGSPTPDKQDRCTDDMKSVKEITS
jgi:hypothetical protein